MKKVNRELSKVLESMLLESKTDMPFRLMSLEAQRLKTGEQTLNVRINYIYAMQKAIEQVESELDEQLTEIFNLRYNRGSHLTWEEIAEKVHISVRHIYRKRDYIHYLLAQELSLI